jgi:hypothetical protein
MIQLVSKHSKRSEPSTMQGAFPPPSTGALQATSPRYSNAFQTKQEAEAFAEKAGQELLANLKRNVSAGTLTS